MHVIEAGEVEIDWTFLQGFIFIKNKERVKWIDENEKKKKKKKRKENESGLKQGLLRGGISQIARTGRLQGIAGRTRTLAGSARIPFPGLLILVSFFFI